MTSEDQETGVRLVGVHAEKFIAAVSAAVASMLAALATLACAWAIDPEPGPAVLAAVLCLSFARSHLDRDWRGRLEAALALPLVSLVAIGVGLLLHRLPWLGAIAFTSGLFLSIWLRRFGPMARRAGTLIALPFIVILTTPHVSTHRLGPAMALLVPIIVALLALFWVALFQTLARRLRWLPAPHHREVAPVRATESTMHPRPSTRMAIQMAVALGAAFVIGFVFFAERWAWIVLTAYIVNSGNRGRLDVAYKSVLRFLGAAVGTLAALAVTAMALHGGELAAAILVALFLGLCLRPFNYAWWALFITIALALLQGFDAAPAHDLLTLRLEEILIGAIIGLAVAWLVYPIRSRDVLRRRLADALAALAEAIDPAVAERSPTRFDAALVELDHIAPAFRASRLVMRRRPHPADWIDTLKDSAAALHAVIARGETPTPLRKAVAAARKALREPEQLHAALLVMQGTLTRPTQPPGRDMAGDDDHDNRRE